MVEQGERSRANSLRQSKLIPAVEYIQANRHRKILIDETDELFKKYDLILSPSFGKNQMLITNLTGHPALSLPNGFDDEGSPTSISIIGNYGAYIHKKSMSNKELNVIKRKQEILQFYIPMINNSIESDSILIEQIKSEIK